MKEQLTRNYIALAAGIAELFGWELHIQMHGMGESRLVAEHPLFGTLVYE